MNIPRLPRRATWLAAGLLAVAGVAVVIGAVRPQPLEPEASPAPTSSPTGSAAPGPTRAPTPVPDVPRQDADLAAQVDESELAPVQLELPTLGIALPVDPVGIEPDGQMEIPPHAERAGWYRYGPHPGADQGTAVIAAHVDSVASAGLGPFAKLKDLATGDEATVALADGRVVRFAVEEVTSLPKGEVIWPEVFDREGPARLVLVTCGGTWNPEVRHYSNNVIVSLTPVVGDGAA